jgi:hypothetical protein
LPAMAEPQKDIPLPEPLEWNPLHQLIQEIFL